MRTSAWLLIPLLSCVVACKTDPKKAQDTPSAQVPVASAPAEKPTPPKPSDFDGEQLLASLKCSAKKPSGPCEVLSAYNQGKAWDQKTIQGNDARYFGKAFVSKGDELVEQYTYLILKKVPLNEVEGGDLPVKIALRELDSSLEAENNHAEKLLWKLSRDDGIGKRNRAAAYVKTYAPSRWEGARKTKGKSILLHAGSGAYVREGKNRALILIKLEPVAVGSRAGDGLYVKLYPLTW